MNRTLGKSIAVLGLLACVLIARPAAHELRAHRPPRPPSQQIGVGPLLGSVLTGSFRPLLLTYLWMRTDTLSGQGRTDELHRTFRTILALYPNNDAARDFLGWHLAFNLKSESRRRRELAWRWASSGLDTLLEFERGRPTLALWFQVQCGQNPHHPDLPLRYLGRAWADELWWRARAAEWTKRHAGEALGRFEAALWALGNRSDSDALGMRANLLERIVYEDWICRGDTDRFDEAEEALRATAHDTMDYPPLARLNMDRLALLQLIDKRDPRSLPRLRRRIKRKGSWFPYRAGLALISLGARERRSKLVEIGLLALKRLDRELNPNITLFEEERALATAWLRYIARVPGNEPPLPQCPSR